MKRILFCANSLCIGGIEKSLINLLNNLDYKKYKVDLLLESLNGELIDKVPKKVNIIEYKVYNFKFKLFQKILNYANQILWKLKNKNKYDCAICYATYSYAANKISRISSKNTVLFIHSDYTKIYNKIDLQTFFDTRSINQFKKIIFVSNESRDNLIKFYPDIVDKSEVINNIIDIDNIKSLSKEKINNKFDKNDINLLFIGRLEENSKNIITQLKLIKDLKNNLKNIKLYLVGDGPNKEDYIRYIKDNKLEDYIIFLGQKLNPYPYILQADYILLTSNYEGYPVIFNEAIVLKKDIISTIKISDDYCEVGKNFGYLISPNYKETLKEIEKILKNKEHKNINININKINKERLEKLENIFNGVKNEE